jgi:chromate transporter
MGMNYRILGQLFGVFLKVGSFTFGGGYAMLPLIQAEVVGRRHWVSEPEMVDILAISQSLPGVIAINTSIFVGKQVAGVPGAIAAALGMILPAFLAIILILLVLTGLEGNRYVAKVFTGIRAASAALILLAAIKIGKAVLKKQSDYAVAAIALLGIIVFDINAVWAIVFGGVVGYLVYRRNRSAT